MSKLRIETMVLGMVSTNTYILYKEGGKPGSHRRSGGCSGTDSGKVPSAFPDSCCDFADPWPF